MASIVDGCPAFVDGCPFSKLDAVTERPNLLQVMPKGIVSKCPAFADGCPFKQDDSIDFLRNRLSEMPPSHNMGSDNVAANAVRVTLHMVHEKSVALKAQLDGAQCPVFATTCPFKTITSDGEPMLPELDDLIHRWGLASSSPVHRPASRTQTSTVPDLQLEEKAARGGAELDVGEHVPNSHISKSLKVGTRSVHRAAENVRFVRDLLQGIVPLQTFLELTHALHHIYSALESGLESIPPELLHFDLSVVRRTSVLAQDIRDLSGASEGVPFTMREPSPAVRDYVGHIERLTKEQPLLLLAHAYTRYLGDLSGGVILGKAFAKAYDIKDGRGLGFYSFPLIGGTAKDIKDFKMKYRASLDGLLLSAAQADAIVDEARIAFLRNMLIFEEFDVAAGHLQRSRTLDEVMSLVELHKSPLDFQRAYNSGPEQQASNARKCPFLPQAPPGVPAGETVAKAPLGVCPWPFVWLHDPRSALARHPAKNVLGAALLWCLLRAARRRPRPAGALLLLGLLFAAHTERARRGRGTGAAFYRPRHVR